MSTTTATDASDGEFAGQVSGIALDIFNPDKAGGAGMNTVPVASYTYDNAGRLASVTDPRSGLTTSYAYDAAGLLTSVTPAGPTGGRGDITVEDGSDDIDGGSAMLARLKIMFERPVLPYTLFFLVVLIVVASITSSLVVSLVTMSVTGAVLGWLVDTRAATRANSHDRRGT